MLQQQQSQKPARTRPKCLRWLWLQSPSKGDKFIMTYKERLKPWAVARLLPNGQWAIVGRYHSRSDADGHLQLLRQRVPNFQFQVVFDLLKGKG
jgi:hypothetical protein